MAKNLSNYSLKNDPLRPNLLARLPFAPRKIVLMRASRIGDFLCATPALRALRARLPEAEIHVITVPLLQEVASRLSSVDRVWPFPGFPGIAEQLFAPRQTIDFLQQIQQEQFDLAIQMQGTGVYSNPFVLLLGARATAGFIRPGDSPGLLDAALPYPHHLHEIHCVQALTAFLGAPPKGENLEFPLNPLEQRKAAALLSAWPLPWIGLHPSSRDRTRRWPLEHFVSLATQLLARQGGTIVLLGDDEASPASHFIEQRQQARCLNLTGQISLPMLGAIIERLGVLITNDSGPAHIAYALRTPTVTLFGSSASPQKNGPLAPGPFRLLSACRHPHTGALAASPPDPWCIQRISVAQVLAAAEELLCAIHC